MDNHDEIVDGESTDETDCDMKCEIQPRDLKRQRADISDIENCTPEYLENESPDDGGSEDEYTTRLSKRQKRFDLSSTIYSSDSSEQLRAKFDDFLFLQCRKKTRPLSRQALKMDMESFFNFCTAHFNISRNIKSLYFRASNGTECTAYRNGTNGQWQHMLDFLDQDEPPRIDVFIGNDQNDEIDLKTWFEWLDPCEISEELRELAAELRSCYGNSDKDVGRVLKKIEILVKVGQKCMLQG